MSARQVEREREREREREIIRNTCSTRIYSGTASMIPRIERRHSTADGFLEQTHYLLSSPHSSPACSRAADPITRPLSSREPRITVPQRERGAVVQPSARLRIHPHVLKPHTTHSAPDYSYVSLRLGASAFDAHLQEQQHTG